MTFDVRHAFDTAAHAPRLALPEVHLNVVTGPEEAEVSCPAHVADYF